MNKELHDYIQLLDKVSLKAGLKKAMAISSVGNLYLQRKAPWKLLKENKRAAAGSCLTYSANLAVLVVSILEPYLGSNFSKKAFKQLGIDHQPGVNNIIPDEFSPSKWVKPGMKTGAPVILFTSLQAGRVSELRAKYAGEQVAGTDAAEAEANNDKTSFALDLRVARIVEIEEHAQSERLFVAKVDAGEESGPRTVVAGLREHYTLQELQNRKVVVVCNLEPATLAGIGSQGMILCADKKKILETLVVDGSLAPGAKLVPEGCTFVSDAPPLDRKAFQVASKPLRVGKEGTIVFNKTHKLVAESNSSLAVTVTKVAEGGKVK